MPKVLAVIDVNPEGHTVRLSDGSVRLLRHSIDPHPQIGEEIEPAADLIAEE